MSNLEHATCLEWLHLELDGELRQDEEPRLRAHLATCAECREERRTLFALQDLLSDANPEVHPEFPHQVLKALPAAPWQRPRPESWGLAVGLMVVLAVAASLLVSRGQSGSGDPTPLLPTVAAMADFVTTSVLAGAGLLAASWRGVGLAVQSFFELSLPNLILSAFVVLGLNLLLFHLLRRSARLEMAVARRRPRDDRPR